MNSLVNRTFGRDDTGATFVAMIVPLIEFGEKVSLLEYESSSGNATVSRPRLDKASTS